MIFFDRIDICEAYAMYAILWAYDAHTAGIDRRLRAIEFRMSPLRDLDGLSENGKTIYGALVRKHQRLYIAYERLARRAPHVIPPWPGSRNVPGPYETAPRTVLSQAGFNPQALDMVCP